MHNDLSAGNLVSVFLLLSARYVRGDTPPFLPRFIRWPGETGQKSTGFRLEQPPQLSGFTRRAEVST